MATLSQTLPLIPFSTCCPPGPRHFLAVGRTHFRLPTLAGDRRSRVLERKIIHGRRVAYGGGEPGGPKGVGGSQFFDENGAVDDMDGYLNHLSLEYDSVWDTKPSWCQPWTIALTGVSAVGFSWIVLHSVVVTTIVSLLIVAWWYIFLYSYPKAYAEAIAERRRRVTSGVEDTFGANKNQ